MEKKLSISSPDRATVVVFVTEIHVQNHDDSPLEIIKTDPTSNQSDRILAAYNLIKERGFKVESTYTEQNEFGDPVVCLFVRKD